MFYGIWTYVIAELLGFFFIGQIIYYIDRLWICKFYNWLRGWGREDPVTPEEELGWFIYNRPAAIRFFWATVVAASESWYAFGHSPTIGVDPLAILIVGILEIPWMMVVWTVIAPFVFMWWHERREEVFEAIDTAEDRIKRGDLDVGGMVRDKAHEIEEAVTERARQGASRVAQSRLSQVWGRMFGRQQKEESTVSFKKIHVDRRQEAKDARKKLSELLYRSKGK